MKMNPVQLLLLISLLFSIIISATSISFKCTVPTTCQGLIGYVSPNTTTLSSIKNLFEISSVHSLLAANSLPLSGSNRTVSANSTVRIPFPCICNNGTGISDRKPVYTVKKGDGLDYIARTIFREFVTYQEIAAVNGIPDPNNIDIGQKLRIPLPCSCDEVGGMRVVHYGHVVESGSSVSLIAKEFGTTEETLMSVNSNVLTDPKDLKAGAILDVPLKACFASMDNTSLESSLLVPNGSYALTANNCLQCSCNSDGSQLQCKQAEGVKVSNWTQCPSTQCTGNLSLGETKTEVCSRITCAYAGYTKDRILTSLTNQSTCPSAGAPGSQTPPNSAAEHGCRWRELFISLIISLLCFSFPW